MASGRSSAGPPSIAVRSAESHLVGESTDQVDGTKPEAGDGNDVERPVLCTHSQPAASSWEQPQSRRFSGDASAAHV